MFKSLNEYATTREFEDAIRAIVHSEISRNRPSCRYAVVEQINYSTRSCYVTFNGDVTMSKVYYRSIAPSAVGQVVAIEGTGTDQYIADVLGPSQNDVDVAALAAPIHWTEPALATGISSHAADPVRYRVIEEFGYRKVQLRGRANISGSRTLLWTMPSSIRPLFNMAPLLIARDPVGGSNVALLEVMANGQMTLSGQTTGVAGTVTKSGGQVSTNSVDPVDETTSTDTNHKHWTTDGPPPSANTWTNFIVAGQSWNTGPHKHGVTGGHSHTGGAHTHGLDSVTAPSWISLNSVEYFL